MAKHDSKNNNFYSELLGCVVVARSLEVLNTLYQAAGNDEGVYLFTAMVAYPLTNKPCILVMLP